MTIDSEKPQKKIETALSIAPFSAPIFSLLATALVFAGISLWSSPQFPLVASLSLLIALLAGWLSAIRAINRIAVLFPPHFESLIRWMHAMSFESLALLLSVLIRPICFLPSHRIAVGARDGRPILLVHGYIHNSSAWIYQRRALRNEGFGPIYVVNLNSRFESIRKHADRIAEKAEQIEKETHRKDLVLIGHSMGGVVCSWYATKLAPKDKVTHVITIGSPLAGTQMARMAIGLSGKEMEPNSDLVKELAPLMATHPFTRFFHIWAKTDQIIIPSASALVGNTPDQEFVIEDIGHLSLLFSPRVMQKMVQWLRT